MDKFQFYFRSADKKPGKGVGDEISDPTKYQNLNTIKDWRRMFSSLYESRFAYDSFTFNTAEHALQYEKLKTSGYIDEAYTFAIESRSDLAQSSGIIAHKNRKLVILTEEQLNAWRTARPAINEKITMAKFSVQPMKSALLGTGDAELWNAGPRINTIRCRTLEKVRGNLRK